MKTTIEQLKERIAMLEAEVAKLKATQRIEYHHHYHAPQPLLGQYMPALPPQYPQLPTVWCGGQAAGLRGLADGFQNTLNGAGAYGPEH